MAARIGNELEHDEMRDEMIDALRTVGGDEAVARVRFTPDPVIRTIVATWPARFETARADALGFKRDAAFVDVVRAYADAYVPRA